jgi:hypothetical protein
MTPLSGRILGAHQKLDRVARRNLELLQPGSRFPKIRSIVHFEGHNGPDAIKRKSPAKDEPWHFIQPFDLSDTQLVVAISDHYKALATALQNDDSVRAAFEAAWLAHAVIDGLTPAHQYPYTEKLIELRGDENLESRNSVKEKILMPGETLRHQVSNNWKFWGPKGLFLTHTAFEWGVSTVIAPLRLVRTMPSASEIAEFQKIGVEAWFRNIAQDVARLNLYDDFCHSGWTMGLSKRVRKQLAPLLAQAVTMTWYGALLDAKKAQS